MADLCAILKKEAVLEETPLGVFDFTNYPSDKLVFLSHKNSIGVEVTDLVLWIYQRFLQNKGIPSSTVLLLKRFFYKTKYHEISIKGIIERFESWFNTVPNLRREDIAKAKKLIDIDEQRRLQAIQNSRKNR